MSQYGAMGYAQHGARYDAILAHYYTGTALGTTDAGAARPGAAAVARSAPTFTGASRAGSRTLSPGADLHARARTGSTRSTCSRGGKRVATFTAPLQVAGGDGTLGPAAGATAARSSSRPDPLGGVDVDQRARRSRTTSAGVVACGVALLVAGRGAQGAGRRRPHLRDHHANGPARSTSTPTRARRCTAACARRRARPTPRSPRRAARSSPTRARPVVTYFFSTSGGRTENIENTSLGGDAAAVAEVRRRPYDSVSPRHRWTPQTLTLSQAGAKLAGLYSGKFRGITVVRRGVSPRIVLADVVGTRGKTRVSGATLRSRLGLFDTWAYFTSIGLKTRKRRAAAEVRPDRRRERLERPRPPGPRACRPTAAPRSRSSAATARTGAPCAPPTVDAAGRYSVTRRAPRHLPRPVLGRRGPQRVTLR